MGWDLSHSIRMRQIPDACCSEKSVSGADCWNKLQHNHSLTRARKGGEIMPSPHVFRQYLPKSERRIF